MSFVSATLSFSEFRSLCDFARGHESVFFQFDQTALILVAIGSDCKTLGVLPRDRFANFRFSGGDPVEAHVKAEQFCAVADELGGDEDTEFRLSVGQTFALESMMDEASDARTLDALPCSSATELGLRSVSLSPPLFDMHGTF
jgi:hypothetical protein